MPVPTGIRHFQTAAAFRAWLAANHAAKDHLQVGFYKKDSGRGGLTYAEALDEALCVGWIDGVRHRVDEESFTIRFTPRRPGSIWSNVNVAHVERLIAEGRMQAVGLAAFAARSAEKTGIYAFERAHAAFTPDQERAFRREKKAWSFWEAQPPGYRKLFTHWVVSAKREETRDARFDKLLQACCDGQRLN